MKIAKIRTDLDLFSDVEIWALIRHGYEVAFKEFKTWNPMLNISFNMPEVGHMWNPCPSVENLCDTQLGAALQKSGVTKFRLWSYDDRASWLLVIILLLVVLVPIIPTVLLSRPLISRSYDTRQAKYVLENAQKIPGKPSPPLTRGVQEALRSIGTTRKTEPLYLDRLSINGVVLPDAHLEHVILWGSDLEDANLEGAKLCDADLGGINLNNAHLNRADLSGAYIWESNIDDPKRPSSLFNAELKDTILEKTILTKANLEKAHLDRALLKSAYLLEANLTNAILEGADLTGANLSGATLKGAILKNANLSNANLSRVEGLTQDQLNSAIYSHGEPRLPEGLGLKPPPKKTVSSAVHSSCRPQ
jgi:uncharacterized protein YjbI with pentapeptide repeats